eukprot:6166087-Karenia_brevis.AAC.1
MVAFQESTIKVPRSRHMWEVQSICAELPGCTKAYTTSRLPVSDYVQERVHDYLRELTEYMNSKIKG